MKEAVIDPIGRDRQTELLAGLGELVRRNRLALVVLTAMIAGNARGRARKAVSRAVALRWLTRNARLVREFLSSLQLLGRGADVAGYRALPRARRPRRLASAPRRLLMWSSAAIQISTVRSDCPVQWRAARLSCAEPARR